MRKNKIRFKPSGVEWLGEVPEHWKVCKIKRISPVKRGASPRPIDDLKYFDEEGEFSWVRISDVTASKKYLTQTTEKLSLLGSSLSVKLNPETFFVSIAGSVGKTAITKIKCCIHDGFVYLPYLKIKPDFLYYLFEGGQLFQGLGKLGTQLNLNTETIGSIHIPIPPNDEIKLITEYLDRETTEIDALIAEKEHMLTLLSEKCEALISHTVTHGLDSSVPMKPSGLDWVGDIPQHWNIFKLKFLIHNLEQGSSPQASNIPAESDELGILKLSAISKGRFIRYENKALQQADDFVIHAHSLKKGDVLITRGNTPQLVGDVCVVPDDEPHLLIPDLVYRLTVRSSKILPKFLSAFLITPQARSQIQSDARGSSGSMVKISQGHILDWRIPVPPKSEQEEIVSTIENEQKKNQELVSNLVNSITLLKERRSALITAAVTGQIKLENMVV